MPHAVRRTVEARHMRDGDLIGMVDGSDTHAVCGGIVEGRVLDKTKLTHFQVRGYCRVITLPRTTPVLVSRMEPTDEENAATRRAYQMLSIDKMMEEALPELEVAREKLIANLKYRPDYHYSAYEDYIEAQVRFLLWQDVKETALGIAKRDDTDPDYVSATRIVRDEVLEALIEARHTSRSTSVMSNAAEDVILEAKSRWLRRLKYTLTD
jgi:hypothetical protein